MRGSVPSIPDKPPGGWDGWRRCIRQYPAGFEIVETWRYGWSQTAVMRPGEHPEMDVTGLWWRPVADGGEAIN